MALKTSESFFRFVTMGAASARRAIDILRTHGHDPCELERYSTSNKIWQTKIKRLRLPDLFCLRCGSRFEIRAKSSLEIKMSDSPNVPGRAWDSGLRDEDSILFLHCHWVQGSAMPAEGCDGFTVGSLRESIGTSKLGPPKSAGEGAERDRQWPAVVAPVPGEVLLVSPDRITVRFDNGRRQTYRLLRRNGAELHPYVIAGQRFRASEEFLAGSPIQRAPLTCRGSVWNANSELASESGLDRFAAVKAIGLLGDMQSARALHDLAEHDDDPRIRLEAMGALIRLKEPGASDLLLRFFTNPPRDDLCMESVLIAGELETAAARNILQEMLDSPAARELEELRAAIVWSLAKGGEAPDCVLGYLGDPSDIVAAHAAVGLAATIRPQGAPQLVEMLRGAGRAVGSAAWVLEHAPCHVLPPLIELASSDHNARHLAVAILGKRRQEEVAPYIQVHPELRNALYSWWSLEDERNWLRLREAKELFEFVNQQTLGPCT